MNNTVWLLFELAVNFYQSVVIIYAMTKLFGSRCDYKTGKRGSRLFAAVLFIYICFSNYLTRFDSFGTILLICLVFLYSVLCLNGKIISKIFMSFSIIVFIMLGTAGILLVVAGLTGVTFDEIVSSRGYPRLIALILIQNVLFFGVRIMVKYRHKRTLHGTEWLKIMVTPVVSFLIIVFIMESLNSQNSSQLQYLYAVLAIIGILIINVLSEYLYHVIERQHMMKAHNEFLLKQYQEQKQMIEDIRILHEDIGRIRHDLKNHILSLMALLKNEQYQEALDYLGYFEHTQFRQLEYTAFIDHTVLNHIINTKYNICRKKGISADCVVNGFPVGITDVDLCIVIGNILDNAIEHSAGTKDKTVKLYLDMGRSRLDILIKNSIDQSVLEYNPDLRTTKDNTYGHGLGLASVREVVRRYHGWIDFYEQDHFFCCHIILRTIEQVSPNMPPE